MRRWWLAPSLLLLAALPIFATIFGSVRGLIHDPQHRPVQGAQVVLRSKSSDWSRTISSNPLGEFRLLAIPIGDYTLTITAPGFDTQEETVQIFSGNAIEVHFALAVAQVNETVEVTGAAAQVDTQSATPSTVLNRNQIAATPGGDGSNSLAMITNYVPGAVMTHDQLHIRGGHQITWLLDGVPVPNTNIASNVGPQFDPKDIDEIEVQRGGYSAEYGDRAYGVFNVVTRSGFERNNEGELVASYGSFNSTDDQISFGSHTDRFAYYASLNGNRTDLGLMTPSETTLHDQASGLGGFASLIYNSSPTDQFRLVTSVRGDHYQVPNNPDQQASGIRDVENEQDAFVNFSWVHTAGQGILLTVSPFYHFNRAHYIGGPNDIPVSPENDRGSNYLGGVVTLGINQGKHNARFGIQGFGQRDNTLFALSSSSPQSLLQDREQLWGGVASAFVEDQFKVTNWFTLTGGLRLTHFSGSISENSADPRIAGAVVIPHLGWVLRGFYGRYYQPPPLLTVSGPLVDVAVQQGFGFLPLHGEKDEQHDFGLTIPVRGWTFDVDNFRTAAKNYFDHDALGNSNIFFPLTIERARIHGWEVSMRSPNIAGRAQIHLAYSHQYVEGRGGITGGLTDFAPPEDGGYFFLDHDQRDTLSVGAQVRMPWRTWASTNLSLGSGFLDGDGPNHLPDHASFDLSLGKSFGEAWSVRLTALNVSNTRFLLDNSNTFGGTHYEFPRQISLQVKYRFKY
jgi:outer membrane receptor protein involved in Fe transport